MSVQSSNVAARNNVKNAICSVPKWTGSFMPNIVTPITAKRKNERNINNDIYAIDEKLLIKHITNMRNFGNAFTNLKILKSLNNRKTATASLPLNGMNEASTIKKSNVFQES